DTNGDGFLDVVVGAPAFENGQTGEGLVLVFPGGLAPQSSVIENEASWNGLGTQAGSRFGFDVSDAGDVDGDGFGDVIVGAPLFDNGQTNEGRAFVFVGSVSGFTTAPDWTGESDQANAQFGSAVAGAGDLNGDGYDDVLVGAPLFDNGQTNEGRAYAYAGSPSGLSTTAAWTEEPDGQGSSFGQAVASAGDVNGDGYDDAIVGAPGAGRAYVYHGSPTGLAATAAWTVQVFGVQFGRAVSSAGDVNADGYADVIVGGTRAFVFLGSPAGLSTTAVWTVAGAPGERLGESVSSAGDVNGDGYGDVIVGAPGFANSLGRALIYLGSSSGPMNAAAWTRYGSKFFDQFGESVSCAGDVNGDGYSDVIVSAPRADFGQNSEGRAYVFVGSANGILNAPVWSAEGNQPGANLGNAVSSAGDVDGNGYSDVLVGAAFFDGGLVAGAAFGYLATPQVLASARLRLR
ncbi:MAG: integrin alpha, partial [Chloroflexi bacterium]|nr:integrin alpha [Chloroflexota bacterium]